MSSEAKKPWPRHTCRIEEIQPIGEHVSVLILEAPDSFQPNAGQWVKVCFSSDGEELPRIYSLASAPFELPKVRICARKFADSQAGAIIDSLKPGDKLDVEGPQGKFLFEAGERDPLLFVASSVAVAPMRAHLLQAEKSDHLRGPSRLFHAVGPEAVLPFQDEMERLAGRVRGFDFDMRLLDEGVDEADESTWKEIRNAARQWVLGLENKESLRAFLAGHGGLLRPLKKELIEELGIPAEHVQTEQFWK